MVSTRVLPGRKEKGPLQYAARHRETVGAGRISSYQQRATPTNPASSHFFHIKNAPKALSKLMQIQFEDLLQVQLQGLLRLQFQGLLQMQLHDARPTSTTVSRSVLILVLQDFAGISLQDLRLVAVVKSSIFNLHLQSSQLQHIFR